MSLEWTKHLPDEPPIERIPEICDTCGWFEQVPHSMTNGHLIDAGICWKYQIWTRLNDSDCEGWESDE